MTPEKLKRLKREVRDIQFTSHINLRYKFLADEVSELIEAYEELKEKQNATNEIDMRRMRRWAVNGIEICDEQTTVMHPSFKTGKDMLEEVLHLVDLVTSSKIRKGEWGW